MLQSCMVSAPHYCPIVVLDASSLCSVAHLHLTHFQIRTCFEGTKQQWGWWAAAGSQEAAFTVIQVFVYLCFQECEILDIIMKMCCEYPVLLLLPLAELV